MRDLIFFLAFLILFFFSLRRPFIAVSLWLWSGLFVPVYWLYGFASHISYNSIFAATTIIGYLIYRGKPAFKINPVFFVVILFFLHTCLTSIFALAPAIIVKIDLIDFSKAILLFIFISLILRKRHHFNLFLWVFVLSIGFMGFVEGLKFIASAGGHRINGPSGNILSDNNHMAVAMCMTIPFIIYLTGETKEKLLKFGLRMMLLMCIIAVLGTFSRGGLIGLTIILGYFWLKSRHKIRSIFVLLLAATLAYNFLPQSWYNRMDTIDNAMADGSFTTRVNSWKIHTLMALDRPLIGGGFKGPQVSYVWRMLAVDIDKFDFIRTPPPGDKGWAAHSIYFQVLGDQGFLGLFWFLLFILLAFLRLSTIERYFAKSAGKESWQCLLAGMTKISILAYCVSGAALSLAYLEMFYAILAVVVCLDQVMKQSVANEKAMPQTGHPAGHQSASIANGVHHEA